MGSGETPTMEEAADVAVVAAVESDEDTAATMPHVSGGSARSRLIPRCFHPQTAHVHATPPRPSIPPAVLLEKKKDGGLALSTTEKADPRETSTSKSSAAHQTCGSRHCMMEEGLILVGGCSLEQLRSFDRATPCTGTRRFLKVRWGLGEVRKY